SDDGSASFSRARAAYTSITVATFGYSTGPYTSVWGLLVALLHYSFDTCGLPMQSIGEAIVYLRDPEHKIDLVPIRAEQDLTIECQPVRILDSS
ncbi:hypothetical protein E2562_030570, partial [Oryza meyeriana var. granulata]